MAVELGRLHQAHYDSSTLPSQFAPITEYEAKIAALERKVGPLTIELDLVKTARGSAPAWRSRHAMLALAHMFAGHTREAYLVAPLAIVPPRECHQTSATPTRRAITANNHAQDP